MELDKFVGKWQEECKHGFDDFAAALGLPQEKKEFYKHAKTVISYNRDGDDWIIDVGIGNDCNGRCFKVKLGEYYDSANLDGTPMKSLIQADGSKFQEKHHMENVDSWMEITRQIEDSGKMLVTTEYKGHVMTSVYSQV